MQFPAFFAGHFREMNTKENFVTGQGRAKFFCLSPPTITFLAVRLWSNKRIEKTLTQRYPYNAKKITVIPIK